MDKSGILHTYGSNFRALKILVAASYSGVNLSLSPNFEFGTTNKSAEFLKKFPSGKVPTYERKDGKLCLSESDAIALYVSNDSLKGKTDEDKAKVFQWIFFAQSELYPAICAWLYPSLSIMPFNKENVAKGRKETENCLTVLDGHLLTKTYLVGESITLADIATFSSLIDLWKNLMDAETRKPFVNVSRWFDTILNQPNVQAVIKSYGYDYSPCKEPVKFDPKKLNEITGGQAGGKKDEKKKKEEKPKQEKKEVKKEPEPEIDETEAILAEEPKSKDPLDALPKGTWVMDDFKRFYSNNDTDKSIPYFWEKFDKENYSIWLGEYKYNHELTKVFMSCNLIAGMYQRLEKLRKNCFASMCLFGEDNNSTISGIWIWRGQDLAFPLSPDWTIDYETYNWTKLNPDSPESKKLVEEYFAWTGKDKEGRAFNQGKIFK
jgi:elongation factor 1-gamma